LPLQLSNIVRTNAAGAFFYFYPRVKALTQKQDLLFQIAITCIPGVGDVIAKNLISYCGSPEQVFLQKKSKLLRIPGIGEKLANSILSFNNFSKAETEIEFIEKHQIQPLFYLDKAYPYRLKNYLESPVMLYYLGNADLNASKIVGIVGTRKASDYGKAFVDELCAGLADTGCIILSGLAYGIDIQAHRAAIKNKLPTVGVMAHGLDRIYPGQHKATAKKMLEYGGLLTEFTSGSNPDRENFPKRNRIVAGLCDVLVVAETATSGGAMITAEIANYYNKEVMALTGRVNEIYSQGCNLLIKKNKAAIITGVNDLIELMNWDLPISKPQQQQLHLGLNEEEQKIINYIRQKQKTGIDDISFELEMDPGMLSFILLDMEFRGILRQLPGKFFELV
jgi:DNA processing protein